MTAADARIAVCMGCRVARCAGPCACTLDGRDVLDHAAAGDCPDGRYPPPGADPAPQPLTLGRLAHGAAGIARAVTGTGGASAELVAARTAVCAGCPDAVLTAGAFDRCRLCGCATWAKVRNAGERCPAGKW